MKTNVMKPCGRVEGLDMERTRIMKQKLKLPKMRRRRVVGRDEVLEMLLRARSKKFQKHVA